MRISRELVERIIVAEDEEQMGEIAARAIMEDIEKFIKKKGRVVMLFASAPSQHSTWRAMIKLAKRRIAAGTFDPSKIIAFHMDEYLGLEPEAPQLFGKVLKNMLFQPLGIKEENIHYFNSRVGYDLAVRLRKAIYNNEPKEVIEELTRKLEEEAEEHAKEIEKEFLKVGGVFDIVVGGIGKHPHIAFNDAPYAKFNDPKTIKVVRLSETSRQQQVDDKEFSRIEDVPTHALTFTLPPIFKARKIHIIVPRALKAEAVRQTLDGPITEQVPASGLKQPNVLKKVRFYLDKDSASLSKVAQEVIRRKGYARVRELRIPEKISLLSEKEGLEGISVVRLPINQRIAVIDYESKVYIGQLIEELKKRNEVKIFKLRELRRILQFSPDIILTPYLDESSNYWKKINQVIQKLEKTDIKIVYYFPKVEEDNVYFFFGEKLMKLKNEAINAHKSQISRIRYDIATNYINRANALYGKIFRVGRGKYAETFKKVLIENGEIEFIRKKSLLNKEDISDKTTAIVVSPHPDDMEIACAASISFLKERGAYVANLVYTSGHYASIPEVDEQNITQEEKKMRKIEIRRKELEEAKKILKIDEYKYLCLDFYESEGGDKISTRDWKEVENLFRDYLEKHMQERKGNFIVFVPDSRDLHPNHRASNFLTLEVLKKLTREKKERVTVLIYRTVWTGKTNLIYYFKRMSARKSKEIAARYEAAATAIAGTEILKGFAKKPPSPEELGGKYAVKLYAETI